MCALEINELKCIFLSGWPDSGRGVRRRPASGGRGKRNSGRHDPAGRGERRARQPEGDRLRIQGYQVSVIK